MKQLTIGLWAVLLIMGLILGLSSMAVARGWSWRSGKAVKGSGVAATDVRTVPAFTGVKSLGSIDVKYRSAAQQSVVVHGDDNLLSKVETSVDGSVLVIDTTANVRPKLRLWVEVTSPELNSIGLRGSGDIEARNVDTNRLTITLAGSGDIDVDGAATELKIKLNGSGDVEADALDSRSASVSIAGSGDVDVWVTDHLNVNISGSGDVSYRGTPSVSESIAGSGDLHPASAHD